MEDLKNLGEYDNIGLYKELNNSTIDDISGQGYWHLEKMQKGVFALTFHCSSSNDSEKDDKRTIFIKSTSDGDIKVEDYEEKNNKP